MKRRGSACYRLAIYLSLMSCLIPSLGPAASASQDPSYINVELSYRPKDPLNQSAFDAFYNMDYDRAVQQFGQILQRHQDDVFAVNHLLMATLFRELYRMGTLNSGEYANDSFVGVPHRPVDPKVQQQLKDLLQRASQLEEQSLASDHNDLASLYARGVTRGQYATYLALIDRAWFAALRNAVGARHDHERVLELAPGATQAKLIVGAHNYVIGSLPWGAKVGASMVGLGGSKEKGLQYLTECAEAPGETAVDAKIILALFLRREHRYQEALQIIRGLIPVYPKSVLLALEEGNLLRGEDKNQEAAEVYRKVWQAGREGRYANQHYEVAALSLGDLLRSQKDLGGAVAAYELVNQVPQVDPEILQKANLGAGQAYDVLQKRDLALKKYQAVIAADGKTSQAEAARKCLHAPCNAS